MNLPHRCHFDLEVKIQELWPFLDLKSEDPKASYEHRLMTQQTLTPSSLLVPWQPEATEYDC